MNIITGPKWAYGCDQCKFGLIDPPPLVMRATVRVQRTAQLHAGRLTFCGCAAGKAYYQNLMNPHETDEDNTPTVHWEGQG